MTRNISTSFRRSAEASFSDEVDLCFLTISHASIADPIRVVWDTRDFFLGTDSFIGFPFDITILSDDENPPTAQLTIQNIDPRIGDTIRSLNSPPRLKIELSLSSDFSYALLLHLNGADGSQTIINSGGNEGVIVAAINHAQIDSAQSVFGGKSLLLDGIDDYLQVTANDLFVFGTDDFTIDFRFRTPEILSTTDYVLYDSGNSQMRIWLPPDALHFILDELSNQILDEFGSPITDGENSTLAVYGGDIATNKLQGTTPILPDTWYHVEVTRRSSVLRMFLNGAQQGGIFYDYLDYIDNSPFIGATNIGGEPTKGWFDEVRIMNGVAAHISDFSIPRSQYIPSYTASPNIIYSADKLFLTNVSVDIMKITGTIVGWDYLQRVWPGPRAMKAVFPGLFR